MKFPLVQLIYIYIYMREREREAPFDIVLIIIQMHVSQALSDISIIEIVNRVSSKHFMLICI